MKMLLVAVLGYSFEVCFLNFVRRNDFTSGVDKLTFFRPSENEVFQPQGLFLGFSGHFLGHFGAQLRKAMTRRALSLDALE